MSDCPVFVHIDNERSLFFLSKKCAICKIAYFLLSFAFLLFLKERKSDRSFRRTFEKSEEKNDRSFALFKRAIALSLFCKERRKE